MILIQGAEMRVLTVATLVCACGLPMAARAQVSAPEGDAAVAAAQPGLRTWVGALDSGLLQVADAARAGDAGGATSLAMRIYLDHMEPLEGYYGEGAPHGSGGVGEQVTALESSFHALLQERQVDEMARQAARMRVALGELVATAERAGVPLIPDAIDVIAADAAAAAGEAETDEIAAIVREIDAARVSYDAGDATTALALVEEAYLERFEVLEPLVPGANVRRIESLVHLQLRPQLAGTADPAVVHGSFNALRAELLAVDEAIAGGTPFWFATVNSFAIIVREGLEAVLLVGALLAYLGAMGAEKKHAQRIYYGVAAGVGASLATWVLARTIIPVTGANRELLEGVTALVAVAVLLYVSHWLFQKAYLHDWKQYLRDHVGKAVTTGSVFAMAGLSFAAVYREGFETVLFYQALLYDAPAGAVLAGFVPGLLLILVVGYGIIRMGLKLPLKKVFGVTNVILLYLAFVFLGKGIYNLQESGAFSPIPLSWVPDSAALQQVFGLYPVAQTVVAQLALATLLVATWVLYRWRAGAQQVAAG